MVWELVSPRLPFGTGKAFCSGIDCMHVALICISYSNERFNS
jgi:hypothetical protein